MLLSTHMLRQRLRRETRPVHDRLDALASALDLTERDDYATFLCAQHAAHEALIRAGHDWAWLMDRRDQLDADLDALGFSGKLPSLPFPADAHPDGVRYVVAGSSLGGKVLQRQWQTSEDARVLAAGRFLSDRGLDAVWRDTLDALSRLDEATDAADAVLNGAHETFGLFERSFRLAMDA